MVENLLFIFFLNFIYFFRLGIILKKASAVDFFDYGQFVKLPFADGWEDERSKIPLLLKDPSFRNGSKYLQVSISSI